MLECLYYMNNHTVSNVIIVMAKHWQSGPVKTRLAASIGEDAARTIYRHVASEFWQQIESPYWQRHLWSADDDSSLDLSNWLTMSDLLAVQTGVDLGERMLNALTQTDTNGWIAVSGTDAPELSADYINELCHKLQDYDVCIAPTYDGGYAMIAMNTVHRSLFENIEWSTSRVLEQTLLAAQKLGLRVHCGNTIRDLDTIDDLNEFAARDFGWAKTNY
jgi:uncharacterized protein